MNFQHINCGMIHDLTPSEEVLVGTIFDEKSVYRQTFIGTASLGTNNLIANGIDDLIQSNGWVFYNSLTKRNINWGDNGTDSCYLEKNNSGGIDLIVSGDFLGETYHFSLDYTKT